MMPDPDQIPGIVPPADPVRRTLVMQALADTFGQLGARLGAAWISILILLAVFAPLIASSYPIAMQTRDGAWHFPLFKGLTAVDLLLLVLFFATVALLILRRWSLGKSILILAIIGGVATPICYFVARPPENVIWESYRQGQASGDIIKAYHTIIPYSANDRMRDHPEQVRIPPGREHWMGTTVFGEDMLSRMVHASRVALTIGLIATGISVVIGVFIGGLMGYFAGAVDLLGMRIVEIVEAIPTLILLLIVTASFPNYGRSIYVIMAVIGLMRWTSNARFIRAEFLKLRNLDFVQAGIAAGLPLRSILFKHMLPNGIAPVLVESSFSIAGAILLESTLSFLGLGLLPEDPSWGQLLNQARSGGTGFNWWIATFPGTAIFLTVFAYILVGEAMRDALDPKLRSHD